MTQLNPYAKPNSVAFKAFEMAKAGTTKAKLVQLCTKADIGPERILRELKLKDFRNIQWSCSFDEESGELKISNVKATGKVSDKKKKKAAVKAAPKSAPKPKVEAKKAEAKDRCEHCGVEGHKRSECELAKQAKRELDKEAKRRAEAK